MTGAKQRGVVERANACSKAKDRLADAKRKLKSLTRNHASSHAIQKARKRVAQEKKAVKKACTDKPVVYDITALSATFDATHTPDPDGNCTYTADVHWTSSLGQNPGTERFSVYYRDRQGRPVYILSGPAGGIPTVDHGHGTATRTCSNPPPGTNGTSTCTFDVHEPGSAQLTSDPNGSRGPIDLEWFFGYPSLQYALPANGASCTNSGSFPPGIDPTDDTTSLFVDPSNPANHFDPVGKSSVPLSTFGAHPTLTFSGSGSASFGGTLVGSWSLSVALQRR